MLTLAYSVLVLRSVVAWLWAWTWIGATLLVLYFAWRFVRAVERIADAQETIAETRPAGDVTDE